MPRHGTLAVVENPDSGPASPPRLDERLFVASALAVLARRRGWVGVAAVTATALSVGYASLQTQQRKWIFQPSPSPMTTPEALATSAQDDGMQSLWIEHTSPSSGRPIRLHALWAPNELPLPHVD